MPDETPSNHVVRFGIFEADLVARELRKRGVRVKIQEQPFRLLAVLLERPGQIITRDDVQQKLWPDDTFVDFEGSLNTAAQKVRQALGDSAESPRFFETIPRVGYRFIAPVAEVEAVTTPNPQEQPATPPTPRLPTALAGAGVAVIVAAVVVGTWLGRQGQEPAPPGLTKFTLSPGIPKEVRGISEITPSPDGRYVAFVRGLDPYRAQLEKMSLVIWDAWRDEYRTLGYGGRICWSPDSRRIGLTTADRIWTIDVETGAEQAVATPLEGPNLNLLYSGGMAWSPDGETIVFAGNGSGENAGLYRVDAGGGEVDLLLQPTPEEVRGRLRYFFPAFLPDVRGRQALVYAVGLVSGPTSIGVLDLETGERRTLVPATSHYRSPLYSPSGHVVYEESEQRLWAVSISLESLELAGDPFVIAESATQPGVTANGTLTYGKIGAGGPVQLAWRDRNGRKLGLIGEPQEFIDTPALSPGGQEVVVKSHSDGAQVDVWIHEVSRPVKRRLTYNEVGNPRPAWRPSGKEVTYNHAQGIWITAADGSGEARLLVEAARSFGFEWSRDGRFLVGSGDSFIWYLRPDAGGKGFERVIFEDNRFDNVGPELSPDGRYLAYESYRSGRPEVWVRPFPEGDGLWQISTGGGGKPRWQGDGSEIFYVAEDTLMAAAVTTQPGFTHGKPQRLFDGDGIFSGRGQTYDVTADGQRFVVIEGERRRTALEIQVVQNWYEEFRGREQD